jgi:tRNA nucleotidyltransferase (CCA-adding enzyme)
MTHPQAIIPNLRDRLAPAQWELLTQAAQEAQSRGWHLYLVGGAIRDLLLADASEKLLLKDIDLVVDGFHRSADTGAGVTLAQAIQKLYPNVRLDVHGAFQTAALLWHNDPVLDSYGSILPPLARNFILIRRRIPKLKPVRFVKTCIGEILQSMLWRFA